MDEQLLSPVSNFGTKCVAKEESSFNAVEKESEKLTAVDSEVYDEEDCSCILRAIEKEAFSSVVSAFRAQGMLSGYKKILLQHLKGALFISDETYHAEISRAANDEILSTVSEVLNPSYDTYAQWGSESMDPVPHTDNIFVRDDISDSESLELNIANELLQLASVHNARLQDENEALSKIISLPKAPYVPERLRLLLCETERDYEGRKDILQPGKEEKLALNSRIAISHDGTEHTPADAAKQFSEAVQDETEHSSKTIAESGVAHPSLTLTSQCDSGPSTSTARQNSQDLVNACSPSNSGSAPVLTPVDASFVQQSAVREDDNTDEQTATEYIRPRKRRLRQRDLSSTCARVQPFRFPSSAPGQKTKPVRGNPDRRPPRQASPPAFLNFATSQSPSIGTHVSHGTLPVLRTVPTCSTTVINSGRLHQVPQITTSGVVIKRPRTSSTAGSEVINMEGTHNTSRQLPGTQNVLRLQQPIQRSYIRSSSGQRFYASPVASAYSNPARPYYGNPNAVLGFMRSVPGVPSSSYTISSVPNTSSASQPQTITPTEIQRLVAQAAASGQSQQCRSFRRPPGINRTFCTPSTSRLSAVSQRQDPNAPSFINLTNLASANSGTPQQQQHQLTLHPSARITQRISAPTVLTATQRTHAVTANPTETNPSLAHGMQLSHIRSNDLALQQSDPDTIAAVNSITQGNDETMVQGPSTDIDRSVIAANSEGNAGTVPIILTYADGTQSGNRANHLIPEQYANGLIHQEGQNVIGYVTTPQCIQ